MPLLLLVYNRQMLLNLWSVKLSTFGLNKSTIPHLPDISERALRCSKWKNVREDGESKRCAGIDYTEAILNFLDLLLSLLFL